MGATLQIYKFKGSRKGTTILFQGKFNFWSALVPFGFIMITAEHFVMKTLQKQLFFLKGITGIPYTSSSQTVWVRPICSMGPHDVHRTTMLRRHTSDVTSSHSVSILHFPKSQQFIPTKQRWYTFVYFHLIIFKRRGSARINWWWILLSALRHPPSSFPPV